ncbi:MAG: LysR family transcriptional regulator [Planctomycetes bacterium]|nr:LysR family transcriptional regulator [Planctomycetota bacterium]
MKSRPDFSLRQIEVFCQVAEQRSFSKAAVAVFLSQPTVSEHMAALERTLGARLFDRVRGSVTLTRAGQVFFEHAHRMLQMQRDAVRALDDLKGAVRGQLDLGGSTIPGTYILPGVVHSFRETHPDVKVSIRCGDSAEIVEMVASGKIEIGLVGSKVKRRGVKAEEISKDELVVICPPGHAWAKKRQVEPSDLAGEAFVMREFGSGTRETVEKQLAEAGVGPLNVPVEVGSTEEVKESVKAGLGVSIVSRRAIGTELAAGALAAVRVKGLDMSRALTLIVSDERTLSGICRAFVEHLQARKGSL